MSQMVIFGVRSDGVIEEVFSLSNSWHGAAMVWTKLGEKYLGKYDYEAECAKRENLRRQGRNPDKELGEYDPLGWTRTWALQSSPEITDAEFCVLMSTFDGCIIGADQFDYVMECFQKFHSEFPGHFGPCAEAIQRMKDRGYVGYCINATSVNQNPWWVYPDGDEEGRPYNVNTGSKHWFFKPEMRAEKLREGKS